MSKGMPPKRKRLTMNEIEPDLLSDDMSDALWKPQKAKKRAPRTKTISQWNSADFIRYITKIANQFGVPFDTTGRDSNSVNRLHDMLLVVYGDGMSNRVIKDYIDWWLGVYGRFQKEPFTVSYMLKDYQIVQFVKQTRKGRQLPETVEVAVSPEPQTETSDDDLYDLGGLSMLVMSKGIVVGYRVLKARKQPNPIMQLSNVMRGFGKEVVEQVVKTTIENAPYRKDDIVDFMSVARPALKYHGITRFSSIEYKGYFQEK
jgi:hypothetical protein